MDPQKEADKHDKERLFEIHHPRTSSDGLGGPICLMCAPVRCPPLWWPSVWYLMAPSSPLMAALLKTPYAAPPPPPLLLITSNFALSLSQIVDNLLLRQANAKGLKMPGNPIFFSFLGAECKISFDAGRIHCKAELCTKDDRMTIVCVFYDILHPLPRSPTFDPGNLPYFHLKLSLSGGGMIFFSYDEGHPKVEM